MFKLRKLMWTAVIVIASAAPVAAQQGGVNAGTQSSIGGRTSSMGGSLGTTGFGSTTSSGLGTSSLGSSSLGTSNFGSTSGGFANNSGGFASTNNNASGVQIQAAPQIPSLVTSNSNLQKSNVLAGYYANPMAKGLLSSGTGGGSFGSPTFGNTTGGTSGGASGGRGASSFGSTNSFGGGLGGRGTNLSNSANQSGIVVPIQSPLAYTAVFQFPTTPPIASRVHTEIRSALDGSSMIANAKGVQVITDRDNNVILRGTVADEDEVRLIEGMVRLTPGVREIRNELAPAVTIGRK